MLTSLRQASKSKVGTVLVAIIGLLIVIGFGAAGVSTLNIGSLTMSSSTLAKVGSLEVTDNDMDVVMQHDLENARQQNPQASYASVVGDFEPLLDQLIDQRSLEAFAQSHGFVLSKRLIDGEIANLPGVRQYGGFTEQGYQTFLAREHMTDAQVRDLITGSMLQRLLITPGATDMKVPVGIATPYASMLLEQRQGQVALVPLTLFTAGLNPTDAQLQQFYSANQGRYMVPEQRVLKIAEVGPDQLANVQASDQEIAQYYNQHQDVYAPQEIRVISQAVVPDQNVANQIAARAKSGMSFVDAVKPAGLSAQDISVGPQTKTQFTQLTSGKVAAAAFSAPAGGVVGPIQSPLGWHVVKIDSVQKKPGKTLAEAKSEIAAKLTADKRKTALSDLANKVQQALDGGSNLDESAKIAGVQVTTTPLITADGNARGDASYKFPPDLTPALKSGFDLQPNEEPVIEQLADDKGFAVVAPAQIVPAAPAPLASIRDQVRSDWIHQASINRAQALAKQIAAKASGAVSLGDAIKQANASIPAPQTVTARRIQLAQLGNKVPPAMAMLFTLGQGRAGVAPDSQGQGFFVVKTGTITPGNALTNPTLIGQVQQEFSDPMSQEMGQELEAAIRKDMKVKRNEPAIQAAKARLASAGG